MLLTVKEKYLIKRPGRERRADKSFETLVHGGALQDKVIRESDDHASSGSSCGYAGYGSLMTCIGERDEMQTQTNHWHLRRDGLEIGGVR
jgi:hypothetical protein